MGNYYTLVPNFPFPFNVNSHIYKNKIEKMRSKVCSLLGKNCHSTAVYAIL